MIDFVLSPVWQEQGPKDLVEKAKKVWPDIEKAKADIISGALKPPFNTQFSISCGPVWLARPPDHPPRRDEASRYPPRWRVVRGGTAKSDLTWQVAVTGAL